MKKFIVLVLLTTSLTSLAGNEKGNGGGAHYCANRANQELYDIYEGRKRFGLTINPIESNSVQSYLVTAVDKIKSKNPTLAIEIKKGLDYLNLPGKFQLDRDLELTPIADANILLKNKGCEYRQVANWDSVSGRVFVDERIYETFSNFHKAGLKLHEAIYAYGREAFEHENSDLSRRLVAEILSTSNDMETISEFTNASDFTTSDGVFHSGLVFTQVAKGQIDLEISVKEESLTELQNYSLEVTCQDEKHKESLEAIKRMNLEIIELQSQLETASRKQKIKIQERISGLEAGVKKINQLSKAYGAISICSKLEANLNTDLGRLEKTVTLKKFDSSYHEFDLSRETQRVSLTFQLKNNGLVIDQVQTVVEAQTHISTEYRGNMGQYKLYDLTNSIDLNFVKILSK